MMNLSLFQYITIGQHTQALNNGLGDRYGKITASINPIQRVKSFLLAGYKDFLEATTQARKLCLLGYSDNQLANFFDCALPTLNKWKLEHNEFSDSIKKEQVSRLIYCLISRIVALNIHSWRCTRAHVKKLCLSVWLKIMKPKKTR